MRAYLGRLGVWIILCIIIPEAAFNDLSLLRLALLVIGGSLFLCFGVVEEDR